MIFGLSRSTTVMPQRGSWMFNEYADDTHRAQAEEFIMELGKFVLAFERLCEGMRYIIMFMLRSQGLNNSRMEQVIVGDKASAELQVLLGALFCELPEQGENDKKCVKDLLKDIKEATEKRNILLHSAWNLGSEAAVSEEELIAGATRYRAKQNSGSGIEIQGFSASYVRELLNGLRRIQVLLHRLQYCVVQSGFNVGVEFNRPL